MTENIVTRLSAASENLASALSELRILLNGEEELDVVLRQNLDGVVEELAKTTPYLDGIAQNERFNLECEQEDGNEYDQFRSDAEADADALASAGWGTDEDYGCYGDDGW